MWLFGRGPDAKMALTNIVIMSDEIASRDLPPNEARRQARRQKDDGPEKETRIRNTGLQNECCLQREARGVAIRYRRKKEETKDSAITAETKKRQHQWPLVSQ